MNRFIWSKFGKYLCVYTTAKHLKDLDGNIVEQFSDNSLSPGMVSNVSNLGSLSSNFIPAMLKIMTSNDLI